MKKFLLLAILALLPITPLSTAKLLQQHARIVMLLSPDNRGGGTGFHVQAPSGKFYIMTNKHVCDLAKTNSKGEDYLDVADGHYITRKKVLKRAKHADLCLVEPIHNDGLTRIGKAKQILPVITAGHGALAVVTSAVGFKRADHIALVCVEGSIFGCYKVKRFLTHAYSMTVIGGHSGSPIIDPLGRLVGVIFAGGPLTSLAMPPEAIHEILEGM